MTWDDVFKILTAAIASAGGVGMIVWLTSKFLVEKVADRLEIKYQAKLTQQLECYKAQLSKKEFISKTRFDTEFKIYQELSEKQITAVYCAGEAVKVARGLYKEDIEQQIEFIDRFCGNLNDAEISLKKYAPFISAQIFEQYKSLDEKISDVFKFIMVKCDAEKHGYSDFNYEYKGHEYSTAQVQSEIERIQKELSKQSDQLIIEIRSYLNNLDVVE